MLSPLQRRLRQIIHTIPEARDVALAGGGALIVRGVAARPTADLDYFATSPGEVASARSHQVPRTRLVKRGHVRGIAVPAPTVSES